MLMNKTDLRYVLSHSKQKFIRLRVYGELQLKVDPARRPYLADGQRNVMFRAV